MSWRNLAPREKPSGQTDLHSEASPSIWQRHGPARFGVSFSGPSWVLAANLRLASPRSRPLTVRVGRDLSQSCSSNLHMGKLRPREWRGIC